MVDVVAGAVAGARIGHPEGALERDGDPGEVGALGVGPRPGQRAGEEFFGQKDRILDRAVRVRGAALPDEVVGAIDLIVPGAAVPVVVAGEIQDAWALDVEGDVEVVGLLVEEVAGVGALVAAGAVVGAAHVRPRPNALVGPALPLAVGVEADGDDRRLVGHGSCGQSEHQAENAEKDAVVQVHGKPFVSKSSCKTLQNNLSGRLQRRYRSNRRDAGTVRPPPRRR
jgi:hypothetical protein